MITQAPMLAPRPHNRDQHPRFSTIPSPDPRETLALMRRFESTTYTVHDYLPLRTERRSQQRRLTVEYLYKAVDFGGFHRDVVAYAMGHLMDRFLATRCEGAQRALNNQNDYQLVALTCLYMAVKLLEIQNIGVDSLVPLANGYYSRDDFVAMEASILKALDYRVAHGPTPLAFAQLLMPLLHSHKINTVALFNHVQYQLELGVSDYNLAFAKPSTVAIAALWNGLENTGLALNEQACMKSTILHALGYDAIQQPLLEYHLCHLQTNLRYLIQAAYGFTTCCAATMAKSCGSSKNSNTQKSPVSTIRKGGDSPGHDSINDIAEVDWLQYT